ncbi:beta-1,3-galactosyltransferase 2-like isoform X1 [Tachysurus vachellii]|uniref:beta-1,3-galactosyltransferase 2-like isoform X1 n=2 Tax=Tachysurus vachellii TaxID=175792 RepID=UPI00296B0050|nr:beta-1,3-galactosyltransferase 2-like isoform X1 [Tachysurus vachellii]
MVETTSKTRERSLDIPEAVSECRCSRLRIGFFLLIASVMLVIYYVNLTEVGDLWSDTIQRIYNTTYNNSKRVAKTTISASSLDWTSAFFQVSEISVSTSALPGEQCTPETTYHVAYPCVYHFIINESKRCENEKPFLVLMVPVAPYNREARDAVRNTWGSEKMVMDKIVRVFFILGQPGPEGREELQQKILHESKEYHDIIQSDFLDSYKNLTIKTMVIMNWLTTYCQNASYAMKIDSDMFLNVNVLMNMLLNAPRENYMTGLVARGAIVLRNPQSKWFLPKDVFPEDFYPPYALGLGYVLSMDIPEKLLEGSKHVKPVYIEDVYLGLCMRYMGIHYTSQADQSLFNVFPVPYNRCRYSKLIATTTHSLQEQVNSWIDLKKPGPTC